MDLTKAQEAFSVGGIRNLIFGMWTHNRRETMKTVKTKCKRYKGKHRKYKKNVCHDCGELGYNYSYSDGERTSDTDDDAEKSDPEDALLAVRLRYTLTRDQAARILRKLRKYRLKYHHYKSIYNTSCSSMWNNHDQAGGTSSDSSNYDTN